MYLLLGIKKSCYNPVYKDEIPSGLELNYWKEPGGNESFIFWQIDCFNCLALAKLYNNYIILWIIYLIHRQGIHKKKGSQYIDQYLRWYFEQMTTLVGVYQLVLL